MKYPENRMSLEVTLPLPESVHSWLGHQLELRGIDSVIYTRYILSLLQQDIADMEISTEREEFWEKKVELRKNKDRKDGRKKSSLGSEEDKRKSAAVECLLSVSDEKSGIVNLVEELCSKLKEIKNDREYFAPLSINVQATEETVCATDSQDPAERYYAAFPALPVEGTPPPISPSLNEGNVWWRNPLKGPLAGETFQSKDIAVCLTDVKIKQENENCSMKVKNKESVSSQKGVKNLADGKENENRSPRNVDPKKKFSPVVTNKGKQNYRKEKKEVERHSKAVRFLSWPPVVEGRSEVTEETKVPSRQKMSDKEKEAEEYCSMVEQMLKELLLSGKGKPKRGEDYPSVMNYLQQGSCEKNLIPEWFREESHSPEFLENDQWYTQPLENIFVTPVSQTRRLYKRHSYPPALFSIEERLDWSDLFHDPFLCFKSPKEYFVFDDVFFPSISKEITCTEMIKMNEDISSKDEKPEFHNLDGPAQIQDLDDNTESPLFLMSDFPTSSEQYSGVLSVPCTDSSFSCSLHKSSAKMSMLQSSEICACSISSTDMSETFQRSFDKDENGVGISSDASSTVSSVEKGYFSDSTEISYVVDASQHSSPFPDMLLLLNYSDEDRCLPPGDCKIDEFEGRYYASKTDLESIFGKGINETGDLEKDIENFEEIGSSAHSPPETALGAKFLDLSIGSYNMFETAITGDLCLGTLDMFENCAKQEYPTLCVDVSFEVGSDGSDAETFKKSPIVVQHEKEIVTVLHEDGDSTKPQITEVDLDEEERDESACFPTDLFSSFGSAGESSGSSSLFSLPKLVDRSYLLDFLGLGDTGAQMECSPSLLFHLSPTAGKGNSCWQSKILLDQFGQSFELGGLNTSATLTWEAVLGKGRQLWKSPLDTSLGCGGQASPICKGRQLWQLWDVNGHKKLPQASDVWQQSGDSNIWNSIFNLSVYAPGLSGNVFGSNDCSVGDDNVFVPEMEVEEDCILGVRFLEEINNTGESAFSGNKFPRYDRSVSEGDIHGLWASSWSYEIPKPGLDTSFELVPSVNSAFQGVIPRKLPHVRSAPNLKYNFVLSGLGDVDKDDSALKNSPPEHLYFSAKTHFRPIQTPVATPEEEIEFRPRDLFGGHASTSGTSYQQYRDPADEINTKFRPKFKIQKDLDKYIQTGGSLDDDDCDCENKGSKTALENMQHIRIPEEDYLVELITAESESKSPVDCDKQIRSAPAEENLRTEVSFSVSKMDDETGIKRMPREERHEGLNCEVLNEGPVLNWSAHLEDPTEGELKLDKNLEQRKLWISQDPVVKSKDVQDMKSLWDGSYDEDSPYSSDIKSCRDIWSAGYESEVLLHHNLDSKCLFLPFRHNDDYHTPEEDGRDPEMFVDFENSKSEHKLYCHYLQGYPEADSFVPGGDLEDCSGPQTYELEGLVPIPDEAVYSSDLEKQWLGRKPRALMDAKKKLPKFRLFKSFSKKPCSFFLEGNCRRSDCKFSHDISNITCRFWEDGLCFKGPLCPFLHGYPSGGESGCLSAPESLDQNFELKKDEFPELSREGKFMQKDLQSQKSTKKVQAHREFLKRTFSTKKNHHRNSSKALEQDRTGPNCRNMNLRVNKEVMITTAYLK